MITNSYFKEKTFANIGLQKLFRQFTFLGSGGVFGHKFKLCFILLVLVINRS